MMKKSIPCVDHRTALQIEEISFFTPTSRWEFIPSADDDQSPRTRLFCFAKYHLVLLACSNSVTCNYPFGVISQTDRGYEAEPLRCLELTFRTAQKARNFLFVVFYLSSFTRINIWLDPHILIVVSCSAITRALFHRRHLCIFASQSLQLRLSPRHLPTTSQDVVKQSFEIARPLHRYSTMCNTGRCWLFPYHRYPHRWRSFRRKTSKTQYSGSAERSTSMVRA